MSVKSIDRKERCRSRSWDLNGRRVFETVTDIVMIDPVCNHILLQKELSTPWNHVLMQG